MKPINLSDFPNDTYIFLKPEKRNEICRKLEEKYGYLTRCRKIVNINFYSFRDGDWKKKGKQIRCYISLQHLKKICDLLNIRVNDLHSHIEEIKTSSRSGVIKSPKLPLEVTPEMFAVLSHLISDGYGGEKGRSVYVNINKEARENFISKLNASFGDVYWSWNPNHPEYVCISKLVPKVLKKYFKIKDLRSRKSKITELIRTAPKEHIIEFLKAIIIDEGRIADSAIYIEFKANPRLTHAVKDLCEKRLGYKCSISKNVLLISCKNFEVIKKEMQNFIIPHKQEKFMKFFKRKARRSYNRYKGTTKKEIITCLLKKPLSVSEIAGMLDLKDSGVRDQICGYNLKEKRIPGLIDLGIVNIQTLGRYSTRIFTISDKNKAEAYLKD